MRSPHLARLHPLRNRAGRPSCASLRRHRQPGRRLGRAAGAQPDSSSTTRSRRLSLSSSLPPVTMPFMCATTDCRRRPMHRSSSAPGERPRPRLRRHRRRNAARGVARKGASFVPFRRGTDRRPGHRSPSWSRTSRGRGSPFDGSGRRPRARPRHTGGPGSSPVAPVFEGSVPGTVRLVRRLGRAGSQHSSLALRARRRRRNPYAAITRGRARDVP